MTQNPPMVRGGRRVVPAGDSNVVSEKNLPNGDVYRGSFFGGAPHGRGKYLWSDGCMYEGDWRRGKANGKGKFSWPSGATFEGEFRCGRMEGFGVFTGPDGATYRGQWLGDRKHGQGTKVYVNGDQYDGTWRRNLQEGQGRYTWQNGNQYVGEWKNGVISGRGVLIWANGNRYDGLWENGVPKGSGVFTWPDGSCYVGTWANGSNKDPNMRSINGTFYPAVRKRSSVDARGSGASSDKIFPRICIWESDGEAGDITCDIIDTLEASQLYKDGYGSAFERAGRVQRAPQSPIWVSPDIKKPGQIIFKGHKNYDLMLNLQLGITYSVGKPVEDPIRELSTSDFDPREKYWTRFPPEGSKNTPPHPSADFRWKDYCPHVFRHLRKLFSVDPADYMLAICGDDALREFSSPGKSGSFFYLTNDDRFMIKTVKKSEVKVLIKMLPSYYMHVSRYGNTLVTKFFGVHCVKPIGGQKVRFIVMGNLFCSEYRIHRRFDLKGSSYGRTADKFDDEIDETTTLKDLDLDFVFRLQTFWYKHVLEQIRRDCEFLESEGIMDYSLLVGIHFRDDLIAASPKISSKGEPFHDFIELTPDDRNPLIKLGANMPAKAEHLIRNREFNLDPFLLSGCGFLNPNKGGEVYEVVLYFGIIDILQDYDISKKLEHAYKSLQVDPNLISAVDPKLYSRRFQDFIGRIFAEDR